MCVNSFLNSIHLIHRFYKSLSKTRQTYLQRSLEMVLAPCLNEFKVIDRLSSPPEFVENEKGSELKIFILEKTSFN